MQRSLFLIVKALHPRFLLVLWISPSELRVWFEHATSTSISLCLRGRKKISHGSRGTLHFLLLNHEPPASRQKSCEAWRSPRPLRRGDAFVICALFLFGAAYSAFCHAVRPAFLQAVHHPAGRHYVLPSTTYRLAEISSPYCQKCRRRTPNRPQQRPAPPERWWRRFSFRLQSLCFRLLLNVRRKIPFPEPFCLICFSFQVFFWLPGSFF